MTVIIIADPVAKPWKIRSPARTFPGALWPPWAFGGISPLLGDDNPAWSAAEGRWDPAGWNVTAPALDGVVIGVSALIGVYRNA